MGRILAIDYGKKRTGIAVTDPLQMIANGLTTVDTHNLFDFIKEYCQKEIVDCFVIGEPKNMDNTPSESQQFITPFVNRLKKNFTIPIEFVDERFTSKIAFRAMIDGGLKKKARQNKSIIDKVSATIILQSYLEQKK